MRNKVERHQEVLENLGFREIRLVGKGMFASVYRGWDEKNNRYVACKVSTGQDILRRESGYLQKLEHPLFADYYDYAQRGELSILVTEYIWGRTLETLLLHRGRLSVKESVRIGGELAQGLRWLHEMREPVIYRDLKPANIMIREDGSVKLIDLGCAGPLNDRAIAGSRGYAAPEQLLGNIASGPYSDVYGLGKVMLDMNSYEDDRYMRRLLDKCVRVRIEERVPDMRAFLYELNQKHRRKRGKQNEYLFEKNMIQFL